MKSTAVIGIFKFVNYVSFHGIPNRYIIAYIQLYLFIFHAFIFKISEF